MQIDVLKIGWNIYSIIKKLDLKKTVHTIRDRRFRFIFYNCFVILKDVLSNLHKH